MNDFLPVDASYDQEQFIALALRHLDGVAGPEEETSLIDQLASDPVRRQWFVTLNRQLGMLREVCLGEAAEDCDQGPAVGGPWSDAKTHPSSIPPIIVDSSPTLHWPIGNFVLSHVAAAVILGIGLLVGLAWRISLPSHEGPIAAKAVGQITALADCEWSKQGSEKRAEGRGERGETKISKSPNHQIPVFLGDRFTIASGLMQITYESGAKVLLQGPCSYEIDSYQSGYLAVGKLTAKVEKGSGVRGQESGVRGQGSGNANHSPLSSLPSALFTVRTPTAVVTDLGTEFGVEVSKSGTTRSHVFQGKVEVRMRPDRNAMPSDPTTTNRTVILIANQSVSVERGRNEIVMVAQEAGLAKLFVRGIYRGNSIEGSFGHRATQNLHIPNHRSPTPRDPRFSPEYRFTDLGTFGGARSNATDINEHGQVVGWADTSAGVSHAFLYADGIMQDIGLPSEHSNANGINAQGIIVGNTGTDDKQRVFVYRDGKMYILPSLGGRISIARGVNDVGTVVGMSENAHGIGRAFIYTERDGLKDLGSLGGPDTRSTASSVNAVGMIAGLSDTHGGLTKAFLYTPGLGMKALDTFGGNPSEAFCINEAGQVVGYSTNHFAKRRPFIYDKQYGVKDLPDVDRPEGVAVGINNIGDIVGFASMSDDTDSETHAFICRDGKAVDLNLLVDLPDGWLLACASAINDSGQIVCLGWSPTNELRAVLLTPIKGVSGNRQGTKN